jgi:hypothetical protein
MKKRLSTVLIVGLVLLFSLTACGEVSSVSDMGNAFMSALNTGDNTTSYQMLHSDIQEEVGGEAGWAEWTSIRKFDEWKFNSTSIENNTATLEGTAVLDDVDYAIILLFDKINEEWKITGISFE